MKRILVLTIICILALSTVSFAQGQPSSKATAAISTAVSCTFSSQNTVGDTLPITSCKDIWTGATVTPTPDQFVQIMSAPIKVSNSQSLFVSPSLVTGLYTSTRTKTSTGTTSTATAMGGVYMRAVLKDNAGNIVAESYPVMACKSADIFGCYFDKNGAKGVVLNTRVQTLTQSLSECVVKLDGVPTGETCDFSLTTELILDTASAHSFNFVFPNVGVGTYNVAIEAAVKSNATVGGTASAIGAAVYGLGSMTVESVRLVHDFSF